MPTPGAQRTQKEERADLKRMRDTMDLQPQTLSTSHGQQDTFLPSKAPTWPERQTHCQLKHCGRNAGAQACVGSRWGAQQGSPGEPRSFRDTSRSLHCSWKKTPYSRVQSPNEGSGSIGAELPPSNVALGMPFSLPTTQLSCRQYGNGHAMILIGPLEDQTG